MSRKADLTGKRFGHLLVLREAAERVEGPEAARYSAWECACLHCGGECVATSRELISNSRRHCGECEPTTTPNYLREYKRYRSRFTPEQRRLYELVLRGRQRNPTNEAEAVDVVMRGMVKIR